MIGIASLVAGLSFLSGLGTPSTAFTVKAVYAPHGYGFTIMNGRITSTLNKGSKSEDSLRWAAAI